MIKHISELIAWGGEVFFQVYEGNKKNVGKETTKGYQLNRPAKLFIGEILEYFQDVTIKGNILIARNTKKSLKGVDKDKKPL